VTLTKRAARGIPSDLATPYRAVSCRGAISARLTSGSAKRPAVRRGVVALAEVRRDAAQSSSEREMRLDPGHPGDLPRGERRFFASRCLPRRCGPGRSGLLVRRRRRGGAPAPGPPAGRRRASTVTGAAPKAPP
jgi:hypothetical protein